MQDFLPLEIIKKKRNNLPLSDGEIAFIIDAFTKGLVPEYQMSALLMAIYFNGMTESETLTLTSAMLNSGKLIQHQTPKFKVDKHSTGGVGDKTSLILGPIVAACGLAVPMISGRGLGHTGGTLDKLESIPGFNTQISSAHFLKMIDELGISFIGQTSEICPADKKLYALRDVTGTVESLPLICASIMSKKLAEGIDGLVLDVKFGQGAFMKDFKKARELALALMSIGKGYHKKVTTVLSSMDQPLGLMAGNALEVQECLDIMSGSTTGSNKDLELMNETRELSLQLSAQMIRLSGVCKTHEEAYHKALGALESGKALELFFKMAKEQNGNVQKLPKPLHQLAIKANRSGFIHAIDTEKIGMLGIKMKMGRRLITDQIDPTAGFKFHNKIADKVNAGDTMVTLFSSKAEDLAALSKDVENCFIIGDASVNKIKLIQEIIT